MRIAHVFTSQSWGGAEIYALKLAKWQMQAGADVGVWVSEGSPMLAEARRIGLRFWTEPIPSRNPSCGPALAAFMQEEGISTLHLHSARSLWAFARIKSHIQCKILLHVHLWVQHSKRDPWHRYLYSKLDHLLVAGPRAQAAADRLLPVKTAKIQILPYGINLSELDNVQSARSTLGFQESDLVFGVFSRLDRQKGIREFIEAANQALASFEKAKILIVGSPTANEPTAKSYAEELKKLAAAGPLKERIRFLPFQNDYLNLVKACDVVALPSYHESYSLSILDAMALSVPVIGTMSGGTPDLITSETGWLAEPQSTPALSAILTEILQNPGSISSKAKKSKEFVYSHHDHHKIVDESLRLAGLLAPKTLPMLVP